MYKQILRPVRSNLAKLYDCFFTIPRDYSFFVFGTHGVGCHSLLYYLSLGRCRDGKKVLPSSMQMFRKDIDILGDFITLRFRNRMLEEVMRDDVGKWGLTFDGGTKSENWIRRNISHCVPAIVLVRDPILTLTSFCNFELYLRAKDCTTKSVDTSNLKEYLFRNMKAIIGFKSNLDPLLKKCSKLLYVDCSDLQGEATFLTMKKVAEFLDIEIDYSLDFTLSINSLLQRFFSRVLYVEQIPFCISTLSRVFEISAYPLYLDDRKYEEILLDYSCLKKYDLHLFVQKKHHEALLKLSHKLEEILEDELEKFEVLFHKYNEVKLESKSIESWLTEEIRTFIRREISEVPNEIRRKWNLQALGMC